MANSIRTPKQGVSANSRRIAQAVDNEEWQKVRLSMKGMSTADKIDVLVNYFETDNFSNHTTDWSKGDEWEDAHDEKDCDVCIRIDNYIKALCRGGQLRAGASIENLLELERFIQK